MCQVWHEGDEKLCAMHKMWKMDAWQMYKKVSSTLAKGNICERCIEAMKEIVEPQEEFLSTMARYS